MQISYFFGAAAGGFVLMAAIGIQALVALFSSIPLAKRRHRECPEFNLKKAYRRIIQVSVLVIAVVVLVTALVIHFTPTAPTLGYLMGMILAFVLSIRRMSPNNAQNQKGFEEAYADCYPPSALNPDDAEEDEEDGEAPESLDAPEVPEDAPASMEDERRS